MSLVIETDAPPLKKWEDGSIRVGGTRVTLETVVEYYKLGRTAEEIAIAFPVLALGDVHATIAYYCKHREQVEAYLKEVEREGAEIRAKIEALPGQKEAVERLLLRMAEHRKQRRSQ